MDDMSDFDMEEMLLGSQKELDDTAKDKDAGDKPVTEDVQQHDIDYFADEMEAIHDMNEF